MCVHILGEEREKEREREREREREDWNKLGREDHQKIVEEVVDKIVN